MFHLGRCSLSVATRFTRCGLCPLVSAMRELGQLFLRPDYLCDSETCCRLPCIPRVHSASPLPKLLLDAYL